MAAAERNLNVVADHQPKYDIIEDVPDKNSISLDAIMLALKALSQRALVALSKLFPFATAMTVFWLWLSIPDPNNNQIVWAGIYAGFIVILNLIVLRK